MLEKINSIPTATLGAVVFVVIIVAYLFSQKKRDLAHGVTLGMSSFGLVGGIKIAYAVIGTRDIGALQDQAAFVIIGVIASTWISCQEIRRCFK